MARKRLSDEICRDLEKKILVGEYKVNKKLPPERDLAEIYMTSRVPIREAIKQLTDKGYIKTTPGSGSVVISQGNFIFESHMGYSVPPVIMDDIHVLRETLDLRRHMEAEAARLAAVNRTTEDIKQIQTALFDSINEIRKLKLQEPNTFFDADLNFHRSIFKASKSRFLMDCYENIPHIVRIHQYMSLKNTTTRDEVVSYHTSIYESILAENEGKAYEAMHKHLSRVEALATLESEH